MSFTVQKSRKQSLKKLIFIVLGLYVMIGSLLYTFQEKLLFLPTTLDQNYQFEFKTEFEEIFIDASDDASLNGLHFKAKKPKGIILYFHGNSGDLSRWGTIVEPFVSFDYDVVVMDYRTYGKSTGKLSEAKLYSDAQLFYDYTLRYFKKENIIIYGRSLGSGIATKIASKHAVKQLILETPYTSIIDVAEHRFPIFPVKPLLKYHFKTVDFLDTVTCSITIFHGTADTVVPYKFGKQLKGFYPNKIKLITIDEGLHNNLREFDLYQKEIEDILK